MPLLMAIGEHTRANINDALEPVSFSKGASIIKQGEWGECMFFLSVGTAYASFETPEGMAVRVRDYSAGDHFGELALLRDEVRASCPQTTHSGACSLLCARRPFFPLQVRAASVVAECACECLRLDRRCGGVPCTRERFPHVHASELTPSSHPHPPFPACTRASRARGSRRT